MNYSQIVLFTHTNDMIYTSLNRLYSKPHTKALAKELIKAKGIKNEELVFVFELNKSLEELGNNPDPDREQFLLENIHTALTCLLKCDYRKERMSANVNHHR